METKTEIYFYGTGGPFGYMSNFYGASFTCDVKNSKSDKKANGKPEKMLFISSEQYYAYRKCMTFNPENKDLVNKILTAPTPAKAKYYGRQVKNFTEAGWNKVKYQVMLEALWLKFSQNDDIRKKLVATNPKMLYEASPYDAVWGIGINEAAAVKLAEQGDRSKFGQNLLGLALVETRARLARLETS